VTAITVLLGFSLSFLRFWSFEIHGEWSWKGVVPACLLAAGILVQLVSLHRALDLRDEAPVHYAATVRIFFTGIAIVVAAVLVATFVA
jgi:hypothetical protein